MFIFLGVSVFAQNNIDEQRIVGTWATESGVTTFIFNSNGRYTFSTVGTPRSGEGYYMVINSKLILQYGSDALITEYYFSTDGRMLIFNYRNNFYWFIKQR
jgi:hypothetical protein